MENTDIKVISNSEGIKSYRKKQQQQKGECVETLNNSVEIKEDGKTNIGAAIPYSHIEETSVENDIDFKVSKNPNQGNIHGLIFMVSNYCYL